MNSRFQQWRLVTTVTLALTVTCQQAHSQDKTLEPVFVFGAKPAAPNSINLDAQANTASRLGVRLRELPAAVYLVDRSTIEATGARNTQEILRSIPGMTAAQAQGGAAGFVSYRGFNGSQLTQLFNSIAVQYDVVSARPVESWIYDRVEAIGGPSSFLFGAGAVGGSINYITKLAERGNFADAQLRAGSFNLFQGSVGLNRQLSSDAGSGNFARLDVNVQRKEGYADGNSSKSLQGATSLLSDLTHKLSHTLALEYQHEKETQPYFGTPLTNPVTGEGRIRADTRFRNYNSRDGLYEQTVFWARSITDFRVHDILQLKNTLYHYDALRDYANVEEYAFNSSNTMVTRFSPLLQRQDQRLTGNRLEATFKGAIGGLKSDWAGGVDYSVNEQTRFPNGPAKTVSVVDPVNFTVGSFFTETGITPGFLPDRDNKVTTLAFFLENRTKLLPNMSVISGLRHDKVDLNLTNRRAITAANPANFSRGYSATTGRVGVVFDLTPSANVYATYATASDPPSGILTTASFAQARINSALTTGKQFEIGSKLDFLDGRASATVAAYRITRNNLSTIDPTNRLNTLLVGQQSSRGIELDGSVRLTAAITMRSNLALVDAKYDAFSQTVGTAVVSRAGNTPPNTPKRVANLGLNYVFAPDWNVNVGVRHVGSVYGDIANRLTAPSYTLLDVGVGYRINGNTSVTARLRNATDKVYASYVSATSLFYLGEPRAADVVLRMTF